MSSGGHEYYGLKWAGLKQIVRNLAFPYDDIENKADNFEAAERKLEKLSTSVVRF